MSKTITYIPDPAYNPEFQEKITARTKLAPGITMAKFLAGYGDNANLNHIANDSEKLRLAKQYVLHAQAMLSVSKNDSEFEDFRLVVAEGLYRPAPGEELLDGSINDSLKKGYAVVYELLDDNGFNAVEKTFDLAVYWKDTLQFDKMILDYDTYDPNGKLNAQIILIMPKIFDPWRVTYSNTFETRFNNYVQATNELIEILMPEEETTAKIYG
jgi:hypothetical protein